MFCSQEQSWACVCVYEKLKVHYQLKACREIIVVKLPARVITKDLTSDALPVASNSACFTDWNRQTGTELAVCHMLVFGLSTFWFSAGYPWHCLPAYVPHSSFVTVTGQLHYTFVGLLYDDANNVLEKRWFSQDHCERPDCNLAFKIHRLLWYFSKSRITWINNKLTYCTALWCKKKCG